MASKARDIADLGSNDVLETTATGLDVTGTLSADGLTVQTAQGNINVRSDASAVDFGREGTNYFRATGASGDFRFSTGNGGYGNVALAIDDNNDVYFYEDTGTTAKMVWSSSAERLGVGTASPNADLDIYSTSPEIRISNSENKTWTGGDEVGRLSFWTRDGSGIGPHETGFIQSINENGGSALSGALAFGVADYNDSAYEAMRLSNNGDLGIGTDTPSTILDVNGEAPTLTLRDSRTGGAWSAGKALGKLDFYTSDGTGIGPHSVASIGVVTGGANTAAPDGELVFATGPYNVASTERMRIDSSGNVGIGESDPSGYWGQANHLVINDGNAGITIKSSSVGNGRLVFTDTKSTTSGLSDGGMITYGHATDVMTFQTNGSERARLDSSGNLLVGTTGGDFNPKMAVHSGGRSYALEVKAQSGTTAPLIIRNDNGASGTRNQVFFLYGGTTVGSITSTSSSTIYGTSSDERLKENIQDTTHTVDIDDIQVREFDWKVDGSHQRYGFIAQELETVYPEAVHSPDEEDEMKSVDYSKLVPLLVKEIQTLKTRIETLENN